MKKPREGYVWFWLSGTLGVVALWAMGLDFGLGFLWFVAIPSCIAATMLQLIEWVDDFVLFCRKQK